MLRRAARRLVVVLRQREVEPAVEVHRRADFVTGDVDHHQVRGLAVEAAGVPALVANRGPAFVARDLFDVVGDPVAVRAGDANLFGRTLLRVLGERAVGAAVGDVVARREIAQSFDALRFFRRKAAIDLARRFSCRRYGSAQLLRVTRNDIRRESSREAIAPRGDAAALRDLGAERLGKREHAKLLVDGLVTHAVADDDVEVVRVRRFEADGLDRQARARLGAGEVVADAGAVALDLGERVELRARRAVDEIRQEAGRAIVCRSYEGERRRRRPEVRRAQRRLRHIGRAGVAACDFDARAGRAVSGDRDRNGEGLRDAISAVDDELHREARAATTRSEVDAHAALGERAS